MLSATLALLAGCGTPGAPQPPSLRLPKPVSDLEAIRKGDDVYLRWTVPTKTTDGAGIRRTDMGQTRICRGYVTERPDTCRDRAADITAKPDATGKATAVDHITDYVGGNRNLLSYTVKVNNDSGKNAGPSNAVLVLLAPSLAAPTLDAKLSPRTVTLSWEAHELPVSTNLKAEYFYRVKRRLQGPPEKQPAEAVLAELPATPGNMILADHAFAWEKTYEYRVAGVTRVLGSDGQILGEFEGQDSPAATVVAHDIFPPPVPSGLQAVYSGEETRKFVDLTWSPQVEGDVAGYNVYRNEGQGAPEKLNSSLIAAPAFRDDKVAAGKVYTYTVTAVDARGNESVKSEPASERVPE